MITHDLLGAPGIRHGFFTRDGGVSDGLFASLNCGFGSLRPSHAEPRGDRDDSNPRLESGRVAGHRHREE